MLHGKEIPGPIYNRNTRSLWLEAQNGARTGLRGKDFQESFICASPSPICCVLGETLTVGFHLVVLINRLTCSLISCFPTKLTSVPAIKSSAKSQQPYFFLHIWLFWWLSGHTDFVHHNLFVLTEQYNSIPKKSVAFTPKYPLQPEEAQDTCVKQSSCVISFSDNRRQTVHVLENL